MAASLNLSRSSPFGNLAEISSRRTFAYLIATLNASHSDYDFSHNLRPTDFKRERNLGKVMANIDSTLGNVRPNPLSFDGSISRSFGSSGAVSVTAASATAPCWGPQMWAMIDKEMTLKDCNVFSWQPSDDPFDEEEGAIWALHYFFFNKNLKRVAYLYVRGVPVMSHSPRLHPRGTATGGIVSASTKRRGLDGDDDLLSPLDAEGANKRARFWLGDKYADRLEASDDDFADDGLMWNRGRNGDFDDYSRFDDEFEDDGYDLEDDDEMMEDDDDQRRKSPVRGMSEDIAARMEIE